jgi:hypothetical protein
MKIDLGMTVVFASMIFFYVRLIQLRGRRKKERREEELARMREPRKRKGSEPAPAKPAERPMIQIVSWWLVGGGAVVMLAGLWLRTADEYLPGFQPYWWVATTIGVLIFTFSLK